MRFRFVSVVGSVSAVSWLLFFVLWAVPFIFWCVRASERERETETVSAREREVRLTFAGI